MDGFLLYLEVVSGTLSHLMMLISVISGVVTMISYMSSFDGNMEPDNPFSNAWRWTSKVFVIALVLVVLLPDKWDLRYIKDGLAEQSNCNN